MIDTAIHIWAFQQIAWAILIAVLAVIAFIGWRRTRKTPAERQIEADRDRYLADLCARTKAVSDANPERQAFYARWPVKNTDDPTRHFLG